MPNSFTPEEISQIIEEFFRVVGTRQYIGARYVPIFGRRGEESIQWDNTAPYEPLTIVQYQGNTFTSRQYVPTGVDINNTAFWASTGIYNAQIEQYRQEVLQFDGRITDVEDGLTDLSGELTTQIGNLSDEFTTQIDNLSAIVARDNPYYGKKSIGFGDSNMKGLSTGESEEVCTYRQLCDYLGCTYDNHGVNGARFDTTYTTSPGNILAQIDAVPSDSDVRLVVIIGGINDYHYSDYNYGNYNGYVNATISSALSKFPNADICLIWDQGMQFPNAKMLRYQENMLAKGVRSFRKIVCVPTFDIAYAGSGYYASQNHWNGAGCRAVAQRASALLTGGSPMRGFISRQTINPKSGSGITRALAVVEIVPNLETCTVMQSVNIGLPADMQQNSTNVISAFSEFFDLPIGFSANVGMRDTYFYGDVFNRAGESGARSFTYNVRQFESNYQSLTDGPISVFRNVGEWTWPAADCSVEFNVQMIPWSK